MSKAIPLSELKGSHEETGQDAYELWAKSRNWKAYGDKPMRQWKDCSEIVRKAWIDVSRAYSKAKKTTKVGWYPGIDGNPPLT